MSERVEALETAVECVKNEARLAIDPEWKRKLERDLVVLRRMWKIEAVQSALEEGREP